VRRSISVSASRHAAGYITPLILSLATPFSLLLLALFCCRLSLFRQRDCCPDALPTGAVDVLSPPLRCHDAATLFIIFIAADYFRRFHFAIAMMPRRHFFALLMPRHAITPFASVDVL